MNELHSPAPATASVALDCPWCATVLAVDEADLDGTIRCDGCAVGFELAFAQEARPVQPIRVARAA